MTRMRTNGVTDINKAGRKVSRVKSRMMVMEVESPRTLRPGSWMSGACGGAGCPNVAEPPANKTTPTSEVTAIMRENIRDVVRVIRAPQDLYCFLSRVQLEFRVNR